MWFTVSIRIIAAGGDQLDQVPDRDARRQRLRRDFVDFAESPVPDHQPVRGIKHAQPVGHVGKRGVKSEILFRKRTSKLGLFPSGEQQAQSICAQIHRESSMVARKYGNMIPDNAM